MDVFTVTQPDQPATTVQQLMFRMQLVKMGVGVVIFIMIMILLIVAVSCDPNSKEKLSKETFNPSVVTPTNVSMELQRQGWKLYALPSCPWCVKQMQELDMKYIIYIDCSALQCDNVRAYPTWVNAKTGRKIEGYMKLEQLAKLLN